MVSKLVLIYAPLIFMFVISMFSLAGIEGSEQLGAGFEYENDVAVQTYFYRFDGVPLVFTENMTRSNAEGTASTGWGFSRVEGLGYDFGTGVKTYTILSDFGFPRVEYFMYYTDAGNSTGNLPILYEDYLTYSGQTVGTTNNLLSLTADFNTSYGLIALFVALMVGIGIAGFQVLGSGESETSVQTIFMGIGFIAVWVVFSVISLNLLAQIPLGIGAIFYFGMTLSYVVGLIMNIGK